MSYLIEIKPSCKESIQKSCSKNPVLDKAIRKKMQQIIDNPYHFKPLMHSLAGERRVHILKSFVLIYAINERAKNVTFIYFGHHDDAYKR